MIVVCCPGLTFKGNENPLTLNVGEPVSVTWVMLNVAVPVLVMIKGCDELLLTTSFTKLMVLELN